MQIAFDHQIFEMQRYGGISRYFYELITRLATEPGVAVSPFMGFHINGYGLERHRTRFHHFRGFRQLEIPRGYRLYPKINRFLFDRFLARSQAELYHQTYYAPMGARFRGKRLVTVYDMIHRRYPESFRPGDPTASRQREAVLRADGIISISHATKADLVSLLGLAPERIQVIHLANSLTVPASPQRPLAEPYLLYVGQRGGYKNFDALLGAYHALRDVHRDFLLVCFGGGDWTPEEQDRLRSLGLEGRVRLLSGPDDRLADLYAHATAFVYPSRYEGFGIPPLEAMHYRCPVLVGKTSSIPEVVGEAGLYFDPESPEELAAQLQRLLSDGSLREQLAQRGVEQERRFSWDRCARETLDYYRQIAGGA